MPSSAKIAEVLQFLTVEGRAAFLAAIDSYYTVDKTEVDERVVAKMAAAGIIERPLNFPQLQKLKNENPIHSACVGAATSSLVGQGLANEKFETQMDDISDGSLVTVMGLVIQDMVDTGNGYLEVFRPNGGKIKGLYHLNSNAVSIKKISDVTPDVCYVVEVSGGPYMFQNCKILAPYNESDDLEYRLEQAEYPTIDSSAQVVESSEVIHFKTNGTHYGMPSWMSAIMYIELSNLIYSTVGVMFDNRCIPDLLINIIGNDISQADFDAFVAGIRGNLGKGKAHKTHVTKIGKTPEECTIDVHKLASEQGDPFLWNKDLDQSIDLKVASAHRTPPLLAGITIPGRLGAANELVQAIASYQALNIGPIQHLISRTLYNTLGLTMGKKFEEWKFSTLMETMNLDQLDTAARIKEPPQGRDLNAGVKK